MRETRDIAECEATIATLESQLESLSRDNDALAAENRRLAGDLARADAEWAARLAELERTFGRLQVMAKRAKGGEFIDKPCNWQKALQ